MDPSNTEGSDFDNEKIIEGKIEEIARFVLDGDITNDCSSPHNFLTSLEQITLFELEEYVIEGTFPLGILTNMIELKAWELGLEELEQEDCGENQEPYNPLKMDDYKTLLKTPENQKILKRIALNIFRGNITDDNPSYANEYTGLEQLIIYKFLNEHPKSEEQIIIRYIKSVVKSLRGELQGGTKLTGSLEDIFQLGEE
jgi:hypothetical protein